MRIGVIGLGKLGLPYAVALKAWGGHEVVGWDSSEAVRESIATRTWPHEEAGLADLLSDHGPAIAESLAALVQDCPVLILCVQTPHGPEFEGSTPLPQERQDFDYRFLRQAVTEVVAAAPESRTLIIVSTVLPGTIDRDVLPLLTLRHRVVYHPSFIAMGTTLADLRAPEFSLLGTTYDDPTAADLVRAVWAGVWAREDVPLVHVDIVTAETIKVTYNAAIGAKIVVANAIMELCHHVGANADRVADAFELATQRLSGPRYWRGGMGDGGGCHGRDNIALSWLARRMGAYDVFGWLMQAREAQTGWLGALAADANRRTGSPVEVLGAAYKAGTKLDVGSPAKLLRALLDQREIPRTPGWSETEPLVIEDQPKVFVAASQDQRVAEADYPAGSVFIDPWRRRLRKPGVEVLDVGGGRPWPRLPARPATSYRISALLPTRERPQLALQAAASLRQRCSEPIQVVYRVDIDDPTLDQLRAGLHADDVLVLRPRCGYARIAQMYTEAAALASGDWFLVWNDDSFMEEDGWAQKLLESVEGIAVIGLAFGGNSVEDHSAFPLLSKRFVAAVGFGPSLAVDSYCCELAKLAALYRGVKCEVRHDQQGDATRTHGQRAVAEDPGIRFDDCELGPVVAHLRAAFAARAPS